MAVPRWDKSCAAQRGQAFQGVVTRKREVLIYDAQCIITTTWWRRPSKKTGIFCPFQSVPSPSCRRAYIPLTNSASVMGFLTAFE